MYIQIQDKPWPANKKRKSVSWADEPAFAAGRGTTVGSENKIKQIRKIGGESIAMPTILMILGWRLFFYANEGNEPIHVHCRKGDMECKYWLDRIYFHIEEAFAYNMSSKDTRQIRKVIYEHFEYIEEQWDEFQRRREQ